MSASATPTSICNQALIEVGASPMSDMATEITKEAKIAREIFHPCRRRALAQCGWNGAKKAAQLTQSEDTTPTFWAYAYESPEDLIRVLSIHSSNDMDAGVPYEIAYQSGSGDDESAIKSILSHSNQLYIRYVFDQLDLSAMSPGFHDYLAFELARTFAVALQKSESAKEFTAAESRRRLTLAKALDGQEDYPEKMAEGSWVTGRFGRYGGRTAFQGG